MLQVLYDPMLLECVVPCMTQGSPDYIPCSKEWRRDATEGHAALPRTSPDGLHHDGPVQLEPSEEVVFGPGIQLLDQQAQYVDAQLDGPAREMGEAEATNCRAFIDLEPPVLSPPHTPREASVPQPRKQCKPASSRPKSSRQVVQKSTIPVSLRAQQRLVKELSFVAPAEQVSDKAIEEYLRMYKEPLPKKVIAALKKATRLGNMKMCMALAALTAGVESTDSLTPA